MMDREQLIRERAYAIWQEEGQPSGCEQEHWERAVRDVDAQQDDASGADEAPTADAAQAPADPTDSAVPSPAPAATRTKRTPQQKSVQAKPPQSAARPKRKPGKTPA